MRDTWLTCRLTQTTLGRVCPATPPGRARAEIREGTRKLHLLTIGKRMHIDRADEIAVETSTAGAAGPIAVLETGHRLDVPRSEPVKHEMRACVDLCVR